MSHLGTTQVTVKNTSGGAVTVRGKRLQPDEEICLKTRRREIWDVDPHFEALVNSGTLTITTNTDERHWKKSVSNSDTTSTDYQQKMRLNMDIPASGTYRVGWCANIWSSANAQEVACRVQLDDDSQNLDLQQAKGKDKVAVSGFHYKVLSSGSHTLDLDWKAISGGTATISKARLEYWAESVDEEEI